MVLLDQINVVIENKQTTKHSSFIIERFVVPDHASGLNIAIQVPRDYIKLALIYDSCYNLRAETKLFYEGRLLKIHEEESSTSQDAKHGPIHEGEWIIAFELNQDIDEFVVECIIEIQAE